LAQVVLRPEADAFAFRATFLRHAAILAGAETTCGGACRGGALARPGSGGLKARPYEIPPSRCGRPEGLPLRNPVITMRAALARPGSGGLKACPYRLNALQESGGLKARPYNDDPSTRRGRDAGGRGAGLDSLVA
jgi:hypothetical protein